MSTWTQAFGNAKRTSCVTEGPGSTALYCQWYTTFEPYVHPWVQPIGDTDGNVYVATSAGLHKIDASDGSVIWSYAGRYASTPAWDDGYVYAALTDGRIICLNATSGALVWTWDDATAGFDAALLVSVDGTKLVAPCRDGRVYCVTASTGALAWQYPSAGNDPLAPFNSPAAEYSGSVYILNNDMYLRKLSLSTGALQDTSAKLLGEAFRGQPPVIDGVNGFIYVPSGAPLCKQGWSDGVTWRVDDQTDFWTGATGGDLCGVTTESGFDVYDYSVAGDATQTVIEFVTANPDRVTMQVLDLTSLDEYDLGATYDNCRVPFMPCHTNSGSRWPCAVSDAGDVYVTNWRYSPDVSLATSAGVFKWDVGTPRFIHMDYSPAWDEPLWFTLSDGGDYLHGSLCENRTAFGIDVATPDVTDYWTYGDVGEGLTAIAPGWDDNLIWTTDNPVGTTWSCDGTNKNGNVGCAAVYTALPVPVGNFLYALASNTLVCLGTTVTTTGTRAATLAAEEFTPSVTLDAADAVDLLEAALAFVNTASPEHYRPGYVNHLNSEHDNNNSDTTTHLFVGTGMYGRWIDETLTPLLRAYPYVSSALQDKIRAYVKAEFEAWSCLSNYSWIPNDGSGHGVREWSNVDTSNVRADLDIPVDSFHAYEGYGAANAWWDIRPQHWYTAWLMCDVLEPDDDIDPATLYADMVTAYDGGYPEDYQMLQDHDRDDIFVIHPQALNAHLAGLYGRWQLALLAGETSDAATAKSVLDDYVAFWNDNFSKDLPSGWESGFDTEVPHKRNSMVARNWLWLVPEVVALIQADDGYSASAINAALAEQEANNPFWDLRPGNAPLGEGQQQFLYDYEAHLQAKAWFQEAGQDDLAPYLDAPIFANADCQYIGALTLYLGAEEGSTPEPPAERPVSGQTTVLGVETTLSETEQLNTETYTFDVQSRYFTGPLFAELVSTGFVDVLDGWTDPDTGVPETFTEVTEDVSWQGSETITQSGSSITFQAALQGLNYDKDSFGVGRVIVCWRRIYRPTWSSTATPGWQDWAVAFIGQIMDGGYRENWKQGRAWQRTVTGWNAYLDRYNAPRTTAGMVRITDGASVDGTTELATPGLEADQGEFVGGTTSVALSNIVDGNPNTVYISNTVPSVDDPGEPPGLVDGEVLLTEVSAWPVTGFPAASCWWVEFYNQRTQTDDMGFRVRTGSWNGGDPVITISREAPERIAKTTFGTACANRYWFERAWGQSSGTFLSDVSTYTPGMPAPDPVDGMLGVGNSAVAWAPGGASRTYTYDDVTYWDGATIDSDGINPGDSLVYDWDTETWSINTTPHPGSSRLGDGPVWVQVVLPEQDAATVDEIDGTSTEIELTSTVGFIIPPGSTSAQGVVSSNVFNWTGRTGSTLTGVTWVDVPSAAIPADTAVNPYANGEAQTGYPLTATHLVRRKTPYISDYEVYWSNFEARPYDETGWREDYYDQMHRVSNPGGSLRLTDNLSDGASGYLWVRSILYLIFGMSDDGRVKINEVEADLHQMAVDYGPVDYVDGTRVVDLAENLWAEWAELPADDFSDEADLYNHFAGQLSIAITPLSRVYDDMARIGGCLVRYGPDAQVHWSGDPWWAGGTADTDYTYSFERGAVRGDVTVTDRPETVDYVVVNAISFEGSPHPVRVVYPVPPDGTAPPAWAMTREVSNLVVARDADARSAAMRELAKLKTGSLTATLTVKGVALWALPGLRVALAAELDPDYDPNIQTEDSSWLIERVTHSRVITQGQREWTTTLELRSFMTKRNVRMEEPVGVVL